MSLYEMSPRAAEYRQRLLDFMDQYIYPNEAVYEQQMRELDNPHANPQILDQLKEKARAEGLWNLFHPHKEWGPGLSNLEYAPLAEIMGRVVWASEVFNCNAPDLSLIHI